MVEMDEFVEARRPASPTAQYLNSSVQSMSIVAVLELEVPLNMERFLPVLQDIFLDPINYRYASIMVPCKNGEQEWKKVKVKLHDHIKIPAFPSGLSIDLYDKHFDEYLTKLMTEDLPKHQPMWEIHLINYPTSNGASTFIFKTHHALGDGYSLMGAVLSFLQRADNPSLPLTFPPLRSKSKITSSASMKQHFSSLFHGLKDFGWSFMKASFLKDEPSPIYYESWEDQVKFRKHQLKTLTFPLDDIKQIKNTLGVTINDVIVGMIFLGCRLYMQETNQSLTNAKSSSSILLNTRFLNGYANYELIEDMCKPNSNSWGNQIISLQIPIPEINDSKSLDPAEFVMKVHDYINIKKSPFSTSLFIGFHHLVQKFGGTKVAGKQFHQTVINSCSSIANIIGPVEKMAFAGHPVKGFYCNTSGVSQPLMFTVISYAGEIRIAMAIENSYINPQKFTSCVQNAYQKIQIATCQ